MSWLRVVRPVRRRTAFRSVSGWFAGLLVGVVGVVGVAAVTGLVPAAHAADAGKLVLVLDSSGSMKEKVGGSTKITIAKRALNTVVDHLPADAQVGLRVYGATVENRTDKGACTDSQLVVPIGSDNRAALTQQIATYRPYGETPISYSLEQAAGDLGTSGKRTVVLVSDGEETCDVDPCATAEALAEKGIDLKFDVIGLRVSGRARQQLQCVADKGNGTYYDADDEAQIEDSLDKLATRAFRPFKITGTPLEGASRPGQAPVAAPGQYVDKFPGDDSLLFYRVRRTVPGSTIRVGVTAEAAGFVPTVYLHVGTKEGRPCGNGLGQSVNVGGTETLVTTEASSWVSTAASACNTDPELVVDVSAFAADLAGRPFELLVREEPPIVSARHLEPPDGTIRWQPMSTTGPAGRPPVPGSSLSDSPTLAPGTYATSILTGEKQVYAVPLDWGQRLQVELVAPPRTGALARALSVSDSIDVQLLGPMRGQYQSLSVSGAPRETVTMADSTAAYVKVASTPTVRYLDRAGSSSVRYASIPGLQYIVISKSRTAAQGQFLVPYRLAVKVIGTAGTGAPRYVVPATPTPSPTPSPSDTPSGGSTPVAGPPEGSPGSSEVGGLTLVLVAVGALLVGAVGAVVGLTVHRRRTGGSP